MDAITMGWKRARSHVLVLVAALAGCSTLGGGGRPSASPLQLVKLTPDASAVWLTASATGSIQPMGACVYFVPASGRRQLALWPAGFELEWQAGVPIGVRSNRSGNRVGFGETHTFGGGAMAVSPGNVAEPVPETCSGPAMMLYFE